MNKTFHLSVVLLIGIGLAALLCLALPASASTEVPSQTGIVVDTLEDELNGDGDCSLREAITAANDNTPTDACPGGDGVLTDTITFNVAGTITQTEQIVVTAGGPLVIDCGNAITISGNGINNPVGTLVVKGCTISRTGRGISNEGSLVLVNSVISDNIAILWAGGLSNNGIAEIRDSTISGNIAYTPHMWCAIGGGIVNRGTMTVTNSTLSENVAIGYYGCSSSGGGIHNTGTLRIINSTLSGNGADHGGGIDNRYLGMTTATNTIIANSTWGEAIVVALSSMAVTTSLRTIPAASTPPMAQCPTPTRCWVPCRTMAVPPSCMPCCQVALPSMPAMMPNAHPPISAVYPALSTEMEME